MSTFSEYTRALAESRRLDAGQEAIELHADRLAVDAQEKIEVAVELRGVEEADLRVEPRGAFSLDVRSLRKSGLVRLKGLADGKATLIATGRTASGGRVESLLHLGCLGPLLRLTGFGYIPADA